MQWLLKKRQIRHRHFVFYKLFFFSLKFFGAVFASELCLVFGTTSSIISSCVITESKIIPAKYFSFSQLHVAGFQI